MPESHPWLRWFSKLLVFSTVTLIFIGALVKSHEVGLSVPDWPTTYGYHMFAFPLGDMVGGIFYEHTHRLVASLVGLMTIILVIGLARSSVSKRLKVLGFSALGTVVLQGMLGGLTVLFFLPPAVSIFHALLAQTFLVLTVIVAYGLSAEHSGRMGNHFKGFTDLQIPALVLGSVIFLQLFLGALMRHTGSGLAIPDFPTVAGGWLPAFDQSMLARINDFMFENDLETVTLNQVVIHYIHRLGALLVICSAGFLLVRNFRHSNGSVLYPVSFGIAILLLVQVALGAATVLTLRSPIIASLHVVTGAALLGFSVLGILKVYPVQISKSI